MYFLSDVDNLICRWGWLLYEDLFLQEKKVIWQRHYGMKLWLLITAVDDYDAIQIIAPRPMKIQYELL